MYVFSDKILLLFEVLEFSINSRRVLTPTASTVNSLKLFVLSSATTYTMNILNTKRILRQTVMANNIGMDVDKKMEILKEICHSACIYNINWNY